MFCLNIALGNTSWRLLFKTEDRARLVYEVISNPVIENLILDDDFGQQLCAKVAHIHGFMLEDMDKTKLAHVEMALHQARTQILATKMAQSDQGLRTSSMMQGPAVLNPMNGGFRPS
ncbi:MAG: hypothetical protein WC829_01200 [Hyphomicrobium sp.]|jgi:hypothetical protein